MPSATVEDYVKAIYLAQHEPAHSPAGAAPRGRAAPGSVPLGQLAVRMSVVPGTATAMVKALAEAGLVKYESRRGVRLTPGGERLALHVLRKHRIVELFLVEVLKLDWSEVHEEAEALEHAISDKVLSRLDDLLGHPSADPHGDPIPTTAGKLAAARTRPLSEVAPGETVRLVRVDNREGDFLRFAHDAGLVPGISLALTARSRAAATLTVKLKGKPLTLSESAAEKLFVTL
jgi:DtxR family Mn-dependent transcriptional regulator